MPFESLPLSFLVCIVLPLTHCCLNAHSNILMLTVWDPPTCRLRCSTTGSRCT